ncbi:unnamed protein product, partial [Phaeothamnion confervicola]
VGVNTGNVDIEYSGNMSAAGGINAQSGATGADSGNVFVRTIDGNFDIRQGAGTAIAAFSFVNQTGDAGDVLVSHQGVITGAGDFGIVAGSSVFGSGDSGTVTVESVGDIIATQIGIRAASHVAVDGDAGDVS